jgi:hypothetical protein
MKVALASLARTLSGSVTTALLTLKEAGNNKFAHTQATVVFLSTKDNLIYILNSQTQTSRGFNLFTIRTWKTTLDTLTATKNYLPSLKTPDGNYLHSTRKFSI